MPVFTSSIEVTADYPTIKPSLNLNFARSRALDPRITFTRASTATYVGRDGLIKTAGEDEPRFDHDPETLESLGLLIEESRTNLISYSQDFTQSVWQTANNRATCDNTTGIDDPSGGTTASRWSSGTSNGQELIYRQTGTSAGALTGQTCTKSTWIRRVSNDGAVSFFLGDNVGVLVNSQLDSVPVGTWIRCSVTRTIVGNNGDTRNYIAVYPGTDGQPTTIDIWGDQFETGAFPTSYIPTTSAAATREQDEGNITGSAFSSFYNTTEGVLQTEFSRIGSVNNQMVVQFKDGDGSERIEIRGQGAGENSFRMEVIEGGGTGSQEYTFQSGSPVANVVGQFAKVNLAYKQNDFASTINGTIASTDNSGDVGVCDRVGIGYANYGIRYNGHIKNIIYYPKRLTNAQLQTITS